MIRPCVGSPHFVARRENKAPNLGRAFTGAVVQARQHCGAWALRKEDVRDVEARRRDVPGGEAGRHRDAHQDKTCGLITSTEPRELHDAGGWASHVAENHKPSKSGNSECPDCRKPETLRPDPHALVATRSPPDAERAGPCRRTGIAGERVS